MSARPAAPTAAVVYVRVSSDRQAGSGLGREAQEARCRALATARGWGVLSVHVDDGLSGTLPMAKRPGLKAAVAAVRATPGAVLVVHSVSRFARSQKELWALLDAERDPLPLVSATEQFDMSTAMGRAFLGMLGVIAALESGLASERTVAALDAARARGVKLGAPSMVERVVDGVREPDEGKLAIVRRVQELSRSGLSLRDVVARLEADGTPTTSGRGRWHTRTVRTALGVQA